jgi:hypothetical protein
VCVEGGRGGGGGGEGEFIIIIKDMGYLLLNLSSIKVNERNNTKP